MDNERNAPYGSTSGGSTPGSGMGSSGTGSSGLGAGSTGGSGMGASGGMGTSGMGTSGMGTSGMGATGGSQQDQGLADKAKQFASDAQHQAGEKVRTGLDAGKSRAAEAIRELATALRQSGGQGQNGAAVQQLQGMGVQYLSNAGGQVERLADYLEHTDLQEIVTQAERWARRQPALFLGGTFALGLLAGRFLRSSSRQQQANGYSGYGQGYAGATGYATPTRNTLYDQERSLSGYREPMRGASGGTGASSYGAGYGAGASGTTGTTGTTGTSGLSGSAGTAGTAGTSGTTGSTAGSTAGARPGGLSPMGGSSASGATGGATPGATGTGGVGSTTGGQISQAGSQGMSAGAGRTGSGTTGSTGATNATGSTGSTGTTGGSTDGRDDLNLPFGTSTDR